MNGSSKEIELDAIGIWPDDVVLKLAGAWITSADQLVALAATEGGLKALQAATGLEENRLGSLIAQTREMFPPRRLAELEGRIDTSSFGLGAEDPSKLP